MAQEPDNFRQRNKKNAFSFFLPTKKMISFRIVGLMGLVSAHNQEEWYFDQFLGQQELSPPRRLLEKVEMENLSSPPRRLVQRDVGNENYMRPALYFALTVWSPFPVWSPLRSMMRFVILEKSL